MGKAFSCLKRKESSSKPPLYRDEPERDLKLANPKKELEAVSHPLPTTAVPMVRIEESPQTKQQDLRPKNAEQVQKPQISENEIKKKLQELNTEILRLNHEGEVLREKYENAIKEYRLFPKNTSRKNKKFIEATKKLVFLKERMDDVQKKENILKSLLQMHEEQQKNIQFATNAKEASRLVDENKKKIDIATEQLHRVSDIMGEYKVQEGERIEAMDRFDEEEKNEDFFDRVDEIIQNHDEEFHDPTKQPQLIRDLHPPAANAQSSTNLFQAILA
jgi:hypothetical protein